MGITKLTKLFSLMIIVTFFFAAGCSSEKIIIDTSVGEITLKSAKVVDELLGRSVAGPGELMLIISFESKDGGRISGFDRASENVFLTDSSGDKHEIGIVGWETREDYLGFLISESATGLMLNWPGNEPIPIEIKK